MPLRFPSVDRVVLATRVAFLASVLAEAVAFLASVLAEAVVVELAAAVVSLAEVHFGDLLCWVPQLRFLSQ